MRILYDIVCLYDYLTAMKKGGTKKKRIIIDGKRCTLPACVTVETKAGELRLVSNICQNGRRARRYYPYTLEGLKQAEAAASTAKRERKTYGATFGSISDDEKRALDMWRKYRDACERERCPFMSASEVMANALAKMRDDGITPTLAEVAFKYLDHIGRKVEGESTPHLLTVKNRLAKICAVMGEERICNVTEMQITDFVDGLVNPQTGDKAAPNTRKQYILLIKSVFKYAVERGMLDESRNAARNVEAPKVKRTEPATLAVDDVRKVMRHVACTPALHAFIPALAVGLFCGARLAERCRMRYRDTNVKGQVFLSCEITKTNIDRYVKPAPVFTAWMDFAKAHGVDMAPDAFLIRGETETQRKDAHNRALKAISDATGVTFPKNCIRHSAATYMAAKMGMAATADQLGHDEGMLASHYRHAVTRGEADAYFQLTPAACMSDEPLRIVEPSPLPAEYPAQA